MKLAKFLACWFLAGLICSNAIAQSLTLLGVGDAGSAPPPSVAFLANGTCTMTTTTCTIAGVNLGAADPTRLIIIGVSYLSSSATLQSSSTIGGISNTVYVNPTNASNGTGLMGATVPTGTTGSLTINLSAVPGSTNVFYGVWSITNPVSTTPDNTNGINSGTNCATTVTTAANGFAFHQSYSTAASTPTITGTGVIQDFAVSKNGGAHAPTTGASLTITSTVASATSCASVAFH